MLPPKIYVHICSLNILAHFLTKVTGLQQYFYQRFLQKLLSLLVLSQYQVMTARKSSILK